MTLSAGTRLGPHEILSPLGVGGMGEVYRARDSRLGREVAVKVLPARYSDEPERLRRFEAEARSASQLDHPNVPAVHDVGWHEGSRGLAPSSLLVGRFKKEGMRWAGSRDALPDLRLSPGASRRVTRSETPGGFQGRCAPTHLPAHNVFTSANRPQNSPARKLEGDVVNLCQSSGEDRGGRPRIEVDRVYFGLCHVV